MNILVSKKKYCKKCSENNQFHVLNSRLDIPSSTTPISTYPKAMHIRRSNPLNPFHVTKLESILYTKKVLCRYLLCAKSTKKCNFCPDPKRKHI